MVREDSVVSFYSRLRESALAAPHSPLHIFPSTSDVDSLCALKIIFRILESDSIRYSCYPVSSFQEICKHTGDLGLESSGGQPVSMLLVNWGCQRDLRRVLGLGGPADGAAGPRVFVVDSHRPIHLHDLSKRNESVVVLYTSGDEKMAGSGFDFEVSNLADMCNLDYVDEEEDSESGEEDSESEGEEGDEEDGSDRSPRRKKRRRVGGEEDGEELFRRWKREYYHMGSFHGKPSGCLMYDLSHSLRKDANNEVLWLACVSLTDQFVHQRLTDERYQDGVMELEQHINSSRNLEAVTTVTLKDGTKIRAPESTRIACQDEPRLMLFREWNLFESMLCSSYVAPKLKTWTDKGKKNLMRLLAEMGFAIKDCQVGFQYMNLVVKRKMKDEFERFLPGCGLTDFYYKSFLMLHGYRYCVSAADVVYGVTALLESFANSDGSSASKQFGVAYDALSLNNLDKLRFGMQKAISVQKAILSQGGAAMTKVRSERKFRWVKLEDSVDAKLLGYPQALTKFCYFLVDALMERGARAKPMICACISQEPNKMLIVGVCGKPRQGAVQGNAFGSAFRNAAEEIGADFFHELFESSWIVLEKSAANKFILRLTEKL